MDQSKKINKIKIRGKNNMIKKMKRGILGEERDE